MRGEPLVKMNQNDSDLPEREIRDSICIHSYSLRNERNRITNFSQNNGNQNPKLISFKRKKTSEKPLVTRKINQINSLISEWGSRTKILYLKGKLDETLKETEAVYNEMKELAENENIEFDPEWIEDVIFSIDTCNSCVEKYINSRKNDSNSSASGSVSSSIRRCEKENL